MANVTFYLMLRREKPFCVKQLQKVDNVAHGRERAKFRILPSGSSMFVAEYHDGVIAKAYDVQEGRLSQRSKKTRSPRA